MSMKIFSSYYEIKYQLHLTNKTESLLSASQTLYRMNLIILANRNKARNDHQTT